MALLISTTTPFGFQADGCYCRIESVLIEKKTSGTFSASIYLNSEAANTAVPLSIKSFEFPVDLDGPNPIKQAYEHLKTLPEFKDAIDC